MHQSSFKKNGVDTPVKCPNACYKYKRIGTCISMCIVGRKISNIGTRCQRHSCLVSTSAYIILKASMHVVYLKHQFVNCSTSAYINDNAPVQLCTLLFKVLFKAPACTLLFKVKVLFTIIALVR